MKNFELFLETLTYLGFFAAIVFCWYFYLQARNKERMALIEKGVDTSEIFKKIDFPKLEFPWFKLGLLATGVGIGIGFTIIVMEITQNYAMGQIVLVFSIIFFGGIAMMLASTIRSRSERRNG